MSYKLSYKIWQCDRAEFHPSYAALDSKVTNIAQPFFRIPSGAIEAIVGWWAIRYPTIKDSMTALNFIPAMQRSTAKHKKYWPVLLQNVKGSFRCNLVYCVSTAVYITRNWFIVPPYYFKFMKSNTSIIDCCMGQIHRRQYQHYIDRIWLAVLHVTLPSHLFQMDCRSWLVNAIYDNEAEDITNYNSFFSSSSQCILFPGSVSRPKKIYLSSTKKKIQYGCLCVSGNVRP